VDWVPPKEETLLATDITAGRVQKPDAGLDSLRLLRQRQYERTAPLVFVQTDKTLYATGDPLWLSAYVLDRGPAVTPRQPHRASPPGGTDCA
jgi:hypothetical protein